MAEAKDLPRVLGTLLDGHIIWSTDGDVHRVRSGNRWVDTDVQKVTFRLREVVDACIQSGAFDLSVLADHGKSAE